MTQLHLLKGNRFPFVRPKTLRRVAIVCHRNADPDSYLSAYALTRLIKELAPKAEVDIITPEGVTSLTKRLMGRFSHKVIEDGEPEYDLFVAVDVGSTELLSSWLKKMEESDAMKVLVDHHPVQKSSLYDKRVVDPGATSAAEVVYRLFGELSVKIDRDSAEALLCGILFDSQHLAIAGAGALSAVVDLIGGGADIEGVRRMLRTRPDQGESMAKLKAARRMTIFKAGEWTAATTRVGSFQAQVARALIAIGADVSMVEGETEGEMRVSLRASPRFFDGTGIHLGTSVAEKVAERRGGYGGGHATAASLNCPVSEHSPATECLELISGSLGLKFVEVK